MDNTEFQYNDNQTGAQPYWYSPDHRAFVAGPSSGQGNGFEDGRQPFQTHQSYGPMHHQYLPTFSSSLKPSGSSSGNSDPLATPSLLLTPHTLPRYQGFYDGNYIDPALLVLPSQEVAPLPSGEAHAFSSTSPTSDSGTCIHLPDELLTTSTPTTISPGATQLQPIPSSHDELQHAPPTISNYSPAAPKARKQASSTTKTHRAPAASSSSSSRKGRKTGKATKLKASHPPIVKLAPLKVVKTTRRGFDSPVLKVTGARGKVESFMDDNETIGCGYVSAGGIRCLEEIQGGSATARHMGIHLRDEARSFLAHGKKFDIDVNKMVLIVRDTTNYLLDNTHQGNLRSIYKPDLAVVVQHRPFPQIPLNTKEKIGEALRVAEGKVDCLSTSDVILFRSVAAYLAQYYAHMFYSCKCNNRTDAERRKGVWMRIDEYKEGGYGRHICPLAKNHALRGYWRPGSPISPYQRPSVDTKSGSS